MGRLTRWIAYRYLKSKKSHGAVSAIATISIAGVAIATAAVVCVLSVFNGFRDILEDKFDILSSDIVITPAKGKVITNPDSITTRLRAIEGVTSVMPVVSDKALAIFGGHEYPVTIKGVDTDTMSKVSGINSVIMKGGRMPSPVYDDQPIIEEQPDLENMTDEEVLEYFNQDYEEGFESEVIIRPINEALPSVNVAAQLGNMGVGDDFLLFAPTREGTYNPADPSASFQMDSVKVTGIFQTRQKDYDESMVIVPINLARHLFQYDKEATSLEISVAKGKSVGEIKNKIQKDLGDKYVVRDRAELHEVNFRMINVEKWVSFLLLAFILMIAGFNIISTMTMLVLEKRRQMSVMNAIGMRKSKIGAVFRNESLMVSVIGGVLGIALGILLCWLQQEFGLVRLNGDPSTLLMTVYPVKIIWSDVALAFVPSLVLGFIAAVIAASFARSRVVPNPSGNAS